MSRIRGLELLFNLEKKNLKSREDCLVIALHCLLINEHLLCVGLGEAWLDSSSTTTELLPKDWNTNQDVYTLRYITKDKQTRLLLKVVKMEHMLQVNVVKNEDAVVSTSFPIENFIGNVYDEYSSTYENLASLAGSFLADVLQKLQKDQNRPSSSKRSKILYPRSPQMPPAPPRPSTDLQPREPDRPRFPSVPPRSSENLQPAREPYRPRLPGVGKSDLDPTGQVTRGGGMLLDPSGIGIPPRPTIPKGIPKGSVPPGARFDPFMPPNPDPDYKKPPPAEYSDDSD